MLKKVCSAMFLLLSVLALLFSAVYMVPWGKEPYLILGNLLLGLMLLFVSGSVAVRVFHVARGREFLHLAFAGISLAFLVSALAHALLYRSGSYTLPGLFGYVLIPLVFLLLFVFGFIKSRQNRVQGKAKAQSQADFTKKTASLAFLGLCVLYTIRAMAMVIMKDIHPLYVLGGATIGMVLIFIALVFVVRTHAVQRGMEKVLLAYIGVFVLFIGYSLVYGIFISAAQLSIHGMIELLLPPVIYMVLTSVVYAIVRMKNNKFILTEE